MLHTFQFYYKKSIRERENERSAGPAQDKNYQPNCGIMSSTQNTNLSGTDAIYRK